MLEQSSLCALRDGESAYVKNVAGESAMRRRLLDIGLIPGTRVTCQGHSPAGDPAAYLIRGAVIALRSKDAGCVTLERESAACTVREALWA
ncbi:MAG: ferrous iron transport protein A [Clostridia bacterium]|nr:ferrous iron transport protein A [Clostridia bacterium]